MFKGSLRAIKSKCHTEKGNKTVQKSYKQGNQRLLSFFSPLPLTAAFLSSLFGAALRSAACCLATLSAY